MRNLDSTFIKEKNSLENRPIFLYTIHSYDGANDLLLAAYETAVVFDGLTYRAFPIQHDMISENTGGEINSIRVKIANADREVQAYLEQYDWRTKKVTITTVFANELANPDVKREDSYYISSYTTNQEVAEFELTSKLDILQLRLPKRKYMRNHCGFRFKSAECGYAGGELECNKTLQQCRTYGNNARYGGQPSIPMRRIYV